MTEFHKEKIPSIEIGYVEKESEKNKESIQEEYGYSKWFTYSAISLCIVVSVIAFTASYIYGGKAEQARQASEQAKQQVQVVNSSTGAKIEKLLNAREENKKKWHEEQKQIDSSMVKQAQLNSNTEKLEEELKKYNISVIN